jgi:hypothetical protein
MPVETVPKHNLSIVETEVKSIHRPHMIAHFPALVQGGGVKLVHLRNINASTNL